MAIWLLHLDLTAEQEAQLTSRDYLPLPYGANVPDLSRIEQRADLHSRIMHTHSDIPPESVTLLTDRLWTYYSGLQKDDIIAIVMPHAKRLAIANVHMPYLYSPEEGHRVGVSWYPKQIPLWKLGRNKTILLHGTRGMMEITDMQLRTSIRQHLPHGYNRFAGLKWIIAALFLLHAIEYGLQLLK